MNVRADQCPGVLRAVPAWSVRSPVLDGLLNKNQICLDSFFLANSLLPAKFIIHFHLINNVYVLIRKFLLWKVSVSCWIALHFPLYLSLVLPIPLMPALNLLSTTSPKARVRAKYTAWACYNIIFLFHFGRNCTSEKKWNLGKLQIQYNVALRILYLDSQAGNILPNFNFLLYFLFLWTTYNVDCKTMVDLEDLEQCFDCKNFLGWESKY